jgi:Arc/MetJ-type ribon-helix-helix transcriptional regulator
LNTSIDAGTVTGMTELRKITVQVSESLLEKAQEQTGAGVTETVREGLRKLASIRAQQELRTLRGTFKFTVKLNELREDRE